MIAYREVQIAGMIPIFHLIKNIKKTRVVSIQEFVQQKPPQDGHFQTLIGRYANTCRYHLTAAVIFIIPFLLPL